MRAQAPSVGIHLPTPKDRIAAQTPNQMNASANRYLPMFAEVAEERVEGRDRGDAEQAAHPHRVRQPVQDGVDRRHETPERQARPDVAAALARERGAELGGQEGVGHEEEDGQEDQPGEALGTVVRDRPQRVHADERADEEEQHVEATEVLLELRLLLFGRQGLVVGVQHDMVARHCGTRHTGLLLRGYGWTRPPGGRRADEPGSACRMQPTDGCAGRPTGCPERSAAADRQRERRARVRRRGRRAGAPRACAARRPGRSSARSTTTSLPPGRRPGCAVKPSSNVTTTRRTPSSTAKRAGRRLEREQVVERAVAEGEALGRPRLRAPVGSPRSSSARWVIAGSSTSHAARGAPGGARYGWKPKASGTASAPVAWIVVSTPQRVLREPRRDRDPVGEREDREQRGVRRPVEVGREPRGAAVGRRRRPGASGRRWAARRGSAGRDRRRAPARSRVRSRPCARRPRTPRRRAGWPTDTAAAARTSCRSRGTRRAHRAGRAARRRGGSASSRPSRRPRRSAPRGRRRGRRAS